VLRFLNRTISFGLMYKWSTLDGVVIDINYTSIVDTKKSIARYVLALFEI